MYKRVIYGSIFVYSFLILITLVVLGSTSMAGGVIMLGLVLAAVVYHFAGNKLGNMLASGAKKDDGDGPKEMTMDVMVKKTAKEISHLCAGVFVCCTLFIMTTNTNVWLSTPGIEGGKRRENKRRAFERSAFKRREQRVLFSRMSSPPPFVQPTCVYAPPNPSLVQA